MREIKFRAYTEDGIKQGLEFRFYNSVVYMTDEVTGYEYQLDYNELMQYTGLKDKNGVEIYEGDILELTDWYDKTKSIHPVCFIKSAFMCERLGDKEFQYFYLEGNIRLSNNYEIIGNIYENRELLND